MSGAMEVPDAVRTVCTRRVADRRKMWMPVRSVEEWRRDVQLRSVALAFRCVCAFQQRSRKPLAPLHVNLPNTILFMNAWTPS